MAILGFYLVVFCHFKLVLPEQAYWNKNLDNAFFGKNSFYECTREKNIKLLVAFVFAHEKKRLLVFQKENCQEMKWIWLKLIDCGNETMKFK